MIASPVFEMTFLQELCFTEACRSYFSAGATALAVVASSEEVVNFSSSGINLGSFECQWLLP